MLISILVVGCGPSESEPVALTEGTITYNVTYPGRTEGGLMDGVLPKEMIMVFKDDVYTNTISAAGMFDSKIIVDCKKKTAILSFHFGPKKIYTVMSAEVPDSLMHAQFGIPELIPVEGTVMVADFLCKRTFASFDDFEDGPDFEIKYTTDIKIDHPNWCNQFVGLDAVLLEYELKQYGMRLKMSASTVSTEPVDDKEFQIEENFKLVSVEEMIYQFEEVFVNFQ
ncbi:MAG: hypothetical protein JKY54_08570 [Flavobacteriales bacterium]|nr:hypothetical protein [Flavobacteriales bacterium]